MKVYHNSFFAMGSRFNAVFPFFNNEVCEHIFNSIQNEVLRIEFLLSYFYPESRVYKINQSAYKEWVQLDDELLNIIDICLNYSGLTFGAFDITLRPIIEAIKENKTADEELPHSYMNCIELDRPNKAIKFSNKKVKIDFGGFGKGYALESILKLLENSPIENSLISFGESSILSRGSHPGGDYWRVGIKNLYDASDSIHTFNINNGSVSTSGNYYIDDSGQLCGKVNVINPATGKAAEGVSTISVKSGSPLKAEILSTAFLVLDDRQIYETLEKLEDVEAVRICYNNGAADKKLFQKA